jgi:opacity protein-like surface antigen
MTVLDRAVIGALIFMAVLLVGIQTAHASQNWLIPSVGMTRAIHGDDEVTPYAQLALRTHWAPLLSTELGVGYRQDHFNDNTITQRSWPVQASLWLTPVQQLYVGGGVGWYNNSLDFRDDLGIRNRTTQRFGTHVGGGLMVPLGSAVAVDVNAKYVFLERQHVDFVSFDPSNWTTSAGLAFRF